MHKEKSIHHNCTPVSHRSRSHTPSRARVDGYPRHSRKSHWPPLLWCNPQCERWNPYCGYDALEHFILDQIQTAAFGMTIYNDGYKYSEVDTISKARDKVMLRNDNFLAPIASYVQTRTVEVIVDQHNLGAQGTNSISKRHDGMGRAQLWPQRPALRKNHRLIRV